MWRQNTGEALKRSHAVVLLGDRGEHTRAETEEAWRATRAVVMTVIHKAREAMRPDTRSGRQKEDATLTQMKNRVRVELDRLVSRRAGRSTRKQDAYDFEEKWLQAGMAKRELNGHVHATCLNQNRSDAHRQDRSHGQSHRRIYTDHESEEAEREGRLRHC